MNIIEPEQQEKEKREERVYRDSTISQILEKMNIINTILREDKTLLTDEEKISFAGICIKLRKITVDDIYDYSVLNSYNIQLSLLALRITARQIG